MGKETDLVWRGALAVLGEEFSKNAEQLTEGVRDGDPIWAFMSTEIVPEAMN